MQYSSQLKVFYFYYSLITCLNLCRSVILMFYHVTFKHGAFNCDTLCFLCVVCFKFICIMHKPQNILSVLQFAFLIFVVIINLLTEWFTCRSRNKGTRSPNTWIFAGSSNRNGTVQSSTLDLVILICKQLINSINYMIDWVLIQWSYIVVTC